MNFREYSKGAISKYSFREPNRTLRNLSYVQAQIVVTPFTPKWEVMNVIEPDIEKEIVSSNMDYEPRRFRGIQWDTFLPGPPRPHEVGITHFGSRDQKRDIIIHKNGCIQFAEYIECDKIMPHEGISYEVSIAMFPTLAVRLMHVLQFVDEVYSKYVTPKGKHLDNVEVLVKLQSKSSMMILYDEEYAGGWKMLKFPDEAMVKGIETPQHMYSLSESTTPKSSEFKLGYSQKASEIMQNIYRGKGIEESRVKTGCPFFDQRGRYIREKLDEVLNQIR